MKKIFSNILRLPEFDKDMKKLAKRFRTLESDLETFIETGVQAYHKLKRDNKGILQVPGLDIKSPKIFKVKKFTCQSLKGKGVQSGIRLIYAYFEEEDKIELIEIYYKGDKENEDRERILKYYGKRGLKIIL